MQGIARWYIEAVAETPYLVELVGLKGHPIAQSGRRNKSRDPIRVSTNRMPHPWPYDRPRKQGRVNLRERMASKAAFNHDCFPSVLDHFCPYKNRTTSLSTIATCLNRNFQTHVSVNIQSNTYLRWTEHRNLCRKGRSPIIPTADPHRRQHSGTTYRKPRWPKALWENTEETPNLLQGRPIHCTDDQNLVRIIDCI